MKLSMIRPLLVAFTLLSVPALANASLCERLTVKLQRWQELRKLKGRELTHLPMSTTFYLNGNKVTYERALHRYAELILRTGINLQPGDKIELIGNPENFHDDHAPSFAAILERYAYGMGAHIVHRTVGSNEPKYTRLSYGTEHSPLDYIPPTTKALYADMADPAQRWVKIFLDPDSNKYSTSHVDIAKRRAFSRAYADMARTVSTMQSNNEFPWHISLLPNLEYADDIFPNSRDTVLEKLYRAWETQIGILRLDLEDPVAHWQQLNVRLARLAQSLNDLKVQTLRLASQDGKTNFTVGVIPECGWVSCGEDITPDGRSFMANMPSFEIYTSPHRAKINGRVHMSRPAVVEGKTIEGLWLEFFDGKVVNHGADTNADVLDELFEEDPNFRYAGEIALVDILVSPIFQTGMVFKQVLLDENAASHLALGSAYPLGLGHLSEAEQINAGLNVESDLHYDLIFGSELIDVTGIRADGTEIPVMQRGRFVETAPN